MKRCTQIFLLLTALCLTLAAQAQEANIVKPKLAVLPFQNKAGDAWWYQGGAAQDVFVTELMKAMQDVFVTELRKAKRFEVMDPKALDAGFTISDDLINEAKSEKALTLDLDVLALSKRAKVLGINYLLTGAVTEYGNTDVSGGGSASRKTLTVALSAKLIDTSTGEIIWADKARDVQQAGVVEGMDTVDMFKKTVKPCVQQLIKKWQLSRRLDWQQAK